MSGRIPSVPSAARAVPSAASVPSGAAARRGRGPVAEVGKRTTSSRSSDSSDSSSDSEDEQLSGPLSGLFALFADSSPSAPSAPVSPGEKEENVSPATSNLEGFYEYFQDLKRNGVRLTEITYIVNKWALGGIIPMTHHGFCFKTSTGDYFSLDFGRQGIVWDTYGDEIPGLPDNTLLVQTYHIDVDPQTVKHYCEKTKPFAWLTNDCDTWSTGLLLTLGITQKDRN